MGDRLGSLRVKENQCVKKGQVLAELESRDLRKLELEAAATQLQNAEGRLAIERQLADVKIKTAMLNVEKAATADLNMNAQDKKIELLKVHLALTRKDLARVRGLSKDLASDQERERQALAAQQAESELESAEALHSQLRSTNRLGLEAAKLELAAAQAARLQLPFAIPVESLRVNRRLAETQYDRTQIIAPCNGTILKIFVRPGETIGAQPILQMADLERMVVIVEVYENEVKHLRLGQRAIITSKAFPSPYDGDGLRGKVTRIGQMIDNPALKSVDPFAPADRHVAEVEVQLDREGNRLSAAFTNLQVDVRFPKRD
jgi:HlyD family secretion protein